MHFVVHTFVTTRHTHNTIHFEFMIFRMICEYPNPVSFVDHLYVGLIETVGTIEDLEE
jgi:hypothetical protein